MKRKTAVLLLAIVLLCSVTACSGDDELAAIRSRGELRVGVKADVPGFGYLNPDNGVLEGMEIDLARAIAKDILNDENAVKFTYVGSAQMRAAMLENGEIDIAIATFTITEERKETFNFSRPYFTDSIGCLVHIDVAANKMEDLDGKIAGVVRSTTAKTAFESECERLGINVTVLEYASYPEIKLALTNGKIDVFVADKSILYGYLDGECVLLDGGFNPQQYGIGSKKENTKIAARVDALLGKMEKNGELESLLEKWGLKNSH